MADILIKGLALPKKGDSLMIYVFPSGTVDYKGFHEADTHKTTAIELPPHGRLIDADELPILYPSIKNAPTIVEASNGSDN